MMLYLGEVFRNRKNNFFIQLFFSTLPISIKINYSINVFSNYFNSIFLKKKKFGYITCVILLFPVLIFYY